MFAKFEIAKHWYESFISILILRLEGMSGPLDNVSLCDFAGDSDTSLEVSGNSGISLEAIEVEFVLVRMMDS